MSGALDALQEVRHRVGGPDRLTQALRELKLMEAALDSYEATRDKDKLAEVTSRMKQIGPKLKELCMMSECKTPQNAPHLICTAAVARTKQLSAAPAAPVESPRPVQSAPEPDFQRSAAGEAARANTVSGLSDRATMTRSTERSLTNSGPTPGQASQEFLSGVPQKILQGWLKKQGEKGLVKTYKKRYFAQKDFKLYYYKQEGDNNPLGSIDLAAVISVTGVDKSPGVFEVSVDKRTYKLQALSAGDQVQWVEGIRGWRAYADVVASINNRRSVVIPNRPSQAPPPVPNDINSLDAAPAPPGAPYVLAGAYPPPRPSPTPTSAEPAPSPSPSPKPSVSPSPSPSPQPSAYTASAPVSAAATPAGSSSVSVTPVGSSSGSYVSGSAMAMKKSGDVIPRTGTPPVATTSVPVRQPSVGPEVAPTPPASVHVQSDGHRSQNNLPSVSTILNDPTPASLTDLLGPVQPKSAPSTPSNSKIVTSIPSSSPATPSVVPASLGSTRSVPPATPTERRLAGEVGVPPSPSFERSEESVQRYRQVAESLERELGIKNQQLDNLTKELRKREETPKTNGPPSILSTFPGNLDKDAAVIAMEKMIRDLEIALRTKEQQNDDLKVQLAQKTEESRIKDSKIESLGAINTRQAEDIRSKDDAIAKLHDQIQTFKMSAGSKSEMDDRVRIELSKLRISIAAHQAHNSFLESELSRLERDHKAVLEAKQGTIESLQRTLAEARHEHAMFRRKILLQKGADEKYVNELEDAKRELFSALALGIKLNLAMAGEAMTIDVTSLYDEAKDMDFRTWNDWIFRKLRESLPAKAPSRRKTYAFKEL